jgi:hypothetical protein
VSFVRALVVSTEHPDEPAIVDRWVASLVRDGWDVMYAAPFADRGVRPHEGITGLDLPVNGRSSATHKVAAGMLKFRGPEADIVVVSSQELARLAPVDVPVVVASDRPGIDEITARGDGQAGSSATPYATGSDGAGQGRSAIPRQTRGTRPSAALRSGPAG